MKTLLCFLLLAVYTRISYSFDCSNVTNSTKCTAAGQYGCSWSGSACTGSWNLTCTNCLFIDYYTLSATFDGSYTNPYKSLTDACVAAGNTTNQFTFYVLNYNTATQVFLYGNSSNPTVAASPTNLLPVWTDDMWYFNFTNITLPAATTTSIAFFRMSKNFLLQGAIVQWTLTGLQICLDTGATGLNITFQNVNFINSENGGYAGLHFRNTASQSTSNFTYVGGLFSGTNVKIQLLGGTSYFQDINVIGCQSNNGLFALGATHLIVNLYYTNGSPGFSLIVLTAGTNTANIPNITLNYATFENSPMANLVTNTGWRMFNMNYSRFTNITASGSYLITLKDVYSIDKIAVHTFRNVTFDSIKTPHSIFSVSKAGCQVILYGVTMNNITQVTTNSATDLQITSQWPGGLCALTADDAQLNIRWSNFTKIGSHCFGLLKTSFVLRDSLFDNSELIGSSTNLTASAVSLLTANSGISWISIQDLSSLNSTTLQVIIRRTIFKNNILTPLYGGAIRYTGINPGQLLCTDNTFLNLNAAYGGAIYGSNTLLAFNFSNNIFQNNKAYDGGAVYKAAEEGTGKVFYPSVYSSGDQFLSNSAKRNGGAMFLDWESLFLSQALYDSNTAQNGGGLYFVDLDTYWNDQFGGLNQTSFTNNRANNTGGAMKLFFEYSELYDNSSSPTYFNNNIDNLNKSQISTGRPSYYVFSFYEVLIEKIFNELDDLSTYIANSSQTSLAFNISTNDATTQQVISQKSGHEVDYIVALRVFDDNNNFVPYINSERIMAKVTATQNSASNFDAYVVASPVYMTFTGGVIYFKTSMKLVGEPLSQATLNFQGIETSSNMLQALDMLMNFNLEISFKDCEIGDIYDNTTKICDTCSSGTYSLGDPYSDSTICTQCDSATQLCLGGSEIGPQPGYWRYDASLAVMVACPASDACQGALFEEKYYPHGYCEYPYEGNLCNMCAINYAKFGSDESCTDCKTDSMYYLKFVGFFALRIGAVAYSIKVNLTKVSGKKRRSKTLKNGEEKDGRIATEDFQSNLMKIVVNFLQVSTIIFQYKFDWPDFINDVMDVTNKFIPTNSEGFSVDCLVALVSQNNEYIYFIKLVVTLMQPFVLWLAMIGVYVLYLKYKKETLKGNPKVKKNIIVLFVITAFIIQPNLIQATLELFKCTNLRTPDDPAYFMTKNSNIQCWTPTHILWSMGVALPFFLLWGVILPMLLLKKLVAKKDQLHTEEVYSKFAFVYEGLKRKRYYWEFVILIRKTLIIIIFVFLNVISVQAQAFSTFLTVMLFASLHVKFWPYADRRLNNLELFSLVTLAVMTYCGMFFLSGGTNDTLTILLIIIALMFILAFYGTVGFYFAKTYKKTAQKVTRKITTKVRQTLDRSKSRSRSQSNRSSGDSSSNSDAERSKNSVEVKELEHIMDGINLDSPARISKNNNGDDPNQSSLSSVSNIPSETDQENQSIDKRVAVGLGDSVNQSSIVRNFGLKQLSFLHQNSNINNSFNNSSINLLSPARDRDSALSSRRSNNPLFLNIESNLLKPSNSNRSEGGKQSELLDSPRLLKNMGQSYEDSPRIGMSRFGHQASYQDESLILKIPNTPSDIKTDKNGSEAQSQSGAGSDEKM